MTRFRRLLALLLWGRTTPEPSPVTEPATNVTVLTGRHTDQPYDWEGDDDPLPEHNCDDIIARFKRGDFDAC